MSGLRVSRMEHSAILYLYADREAIQIHPDYQRSGDIWRREKRQLLVDSVLNGYDVPKIYLHEFGMGGKEIGGKRFAYAIIDGRQRLEALWKFIDGEYPLDSDFAFLRDPSVKAGGMTYRDLSERYPKLKLLFDSYSLSIITIQTDDVELIEDMFYRLNEAAPLNAAEKRNAMGGPLPEAIRNISQHEFIAKKIPFGNTRYRHYDLVAKFLYVEQRDAVVDTKKKNLDDFVRNYDSGKHKPVDVLTTEVTKSLDQMVFNFEHADALLRSVGMVMTIYHVFRDFVASGQLCLISRDRLEAFEEKRKMNRELAESEIGEADWDLLEFDRLANSLNDGVAIKFRVKVLKAFLISNS